jgi:hypothetical protein
MSGNILMRWAGSTRLVTTEDLAQVPPELIRLYRTAKLLSLLFGVGIVASLVASLRLLFSGENRPWLVLGTAGSLLLLPQFLYYHTLVNNDCLVNLLCALALLCFIAAARRYAGGDRIPAARRGIACAIFTGLGLLTKQSAAVLVPLLPGLVWLRWRCQGNLAPRPRVFDALKHFFVLAATTVAAGGWWVLRSSLAGDPAGLKDQRLAHDWAFRSIELTPELFAKVVIDVTRTFIALFAGSFYGIPDWLYAIYLLIAAVILISLTVTVLRRRREILAVRTPCGLSRFVWSTLAFTVALNLVLIVVYNVQVVAPHGRLLFPTLVASGALFAGALQIISSGRRCVLASLVCALVLIQAGLFAWTFRNRMVPAVVQPSEHLLPLGVIPDGSTLPLGPIWGGTVQQPLSLLPGRLGGFRILIGRNSSLPQFGTVLHARLRTSLAPGSADHEFKPCSFRENGSADRWTEIELTAPLDLSEKTPALLLLQADKPWLHTPGINIYYEITTLESSPLLQPMIVDGQPTAYGLVISAVYR